MPPSVLTAEAIEPYLRDCGYTESRLARNYTFDTVTLPLAGFYGQPWDARSACLAVVEAREDGEAAAATCVALGAPTALVCRADELEWWRLSADGPSESRRVSAVRIEEFFRTHKDALAPEAIYAAKMRRPRLTAQQMWFVDVGLMPATERRTGETLHRWVEEVIQGLALRLGGQLRSGRNFKDLYKTVFWLLAAKLLKEKGVDNFKRITLTNVDDVFTRVGRHYADVDDLPPGGKAWRPAIDEAAHTVAGWGHLGNLSAESLAYLYETALIDTKPRGRAAKRAKGGRDIRKELGIHSTPPMLVDHMLAQLWPMIEDHKPSARRVFEPACGHAGFLVAGMRWLRDFSELDDPVIRHRYLRDRLHGVELDPFAQELAKLQLTLADVPHGNSWRIDDGDMFLPGVLKKAVSACTLLLANPPFEEFTPAERTRFKRAGEPVTAKTKAVEMLKRALPNLPADGVFGVVMPQGFLHDKESKPVRDFLLNECALSEIAVFADNLFEQADHEVAVVMGRRRGTKSFSGRLVYRRVREQGMPAFKDRLAFSSEQQVEQARFTGHADATLFLPDLAEVWDFLRDVPRLGRPVHVQKGFELVGQDLTTSQRLISKTRQLGYVRALLRASDDYDIWRLPKPLWVKLDGEHVRRIGAAAVLGVRQVILNYAPVSREPWRLKAVVDETGVAVSSRFLTFRPKPEGPSLRVLWAVLNSPVANAYAYCFSGKRETLVKEWRDFPLLTVTSERAQAIEGAASTYLSAAEAAAHAALVSPELEQRIQHALLALDAEVLRLYDLPPRLERRLLDLFQGVERKGVGCAFSGYYPSGFSSYLPLHFVISDRFQRAAADRTAERFKPGESDYVRTVLRVASEAFDEE
ncbi:MAG TPA: N-6 DNA methylase [Phycisphaerae bacterium]|nr:N-6 DNA methylase [Phycisphaerae bacterium]